MLNTKKLDQVGDTILEVLVAVAVLSLILGISFTLANRSSLTNQKSAERVQAYNFAQGQMELLKKYIAEDSTASTAPSAGSKFCFRYSVTDPNLVTGVLTLPASFNIDSNYNSADDTCKHGADKRYVTIIERYPSGANDNLYVVKVRWDSVAGSNTDRIDLYHKIFPKTANIWWLIS